jgi:hypothetical protein
MKRLFIAMVVLFASFGATQAKAGWCAYLAAGYACQIVDGVNAYYITNPDFGGYGKYTHGEIGVWAQNKWGQYTVIAWLNPGPAQDQCVWPTGVFKFMRMPMTDTVLANNITYIESYATANGFAWQADYNSPYSARTCGNR